MSKNEGGVVFVTPAGTNTEKTLGATAGNATAAAITVPSGMRYQILYGRVTLVNSQAAAKSVTCYIDDGSGAIRYRCRKSDDTAAAAATYYVSYGVGVNDTDGAADDLSNIALPNPCILEAGEKLMLTINSGVVGDSYTARFYVLAMGVKT